MPLAYSVYAIGIQGKMPLAYAFGIGVLCYWHVDKRNAIGMTGKSGLVG